MAQVDTAVMKRMLLLVGALFLLCLSAVGAGRLLGSKQPVAFAILFTNSDGSPCVRPCLLGIRPGETKYVDAIKWLEAHPFTRGMKTTDVTSPKGKLFTAMDGRDVTLGIGEDANGIVELLILQVGLPPPLILPPAQVASKFDVTLGQVVTVLGTPDYFQLADDSLGHKISYSYFDQIEITTLHAAVQEINVDDKLIYMFIQASPVDKRADMQSWIGFGNLRRYFGVAAHG